MIKNIVFDFGGVLVQYDFKALFASQLFSEESLTTYSTSRWNMV